MKTLVSVIALSLVATSAPAHAGLFDSVKKMAKKELSRAAKRTSDNLVDRATGVKPDAEQEEAAAADVNNDGFADIITGAGAGGGPHVKVFDGQTASLSEGFEQEPGTTVPTADDIIMVETADGFLMIDTMTGETTRIPREALAAMLSQNGTTVPTADEVQAPQQETLAGMLLPAIQRIHAENAKSQRAKLSQNGTTVATASEVQAPQRPQRAKLKQVGTTVATAGEVQAPGGSR